MRAPADRPLSALIAILATVLIFGLLVFFLQRGADNHLSAKAEEAPTTAPE